MTDIRILIVDDHPALRAGLRALLDAEADLMVVGAAATGAEALSLYASLQPDIVVVDLGLPDLDGEIVVERIIESDPCARIIVLTTFGGEATIRRSVAAGARGFLLKDTARREIVGAIRNVAQGMRAISGEVAQKLVEGLQSEDLTPRETDVLKALALGQGNKAIAHQLGISEATVKIHMGHILHKLGAKDRTDALLIALQKGYIRLR